MTIHTPDHRDQIAQILDEVGLNGCFLEFVDSVRDWSKSVGVELNKSDPLAMALLADGKPLIVFKSEIEEDDKPGVLGRMIVGGFDEELARIATPETFFEHLVLHEAAHLLLPNGATEEECDQWAFDRLGSRISPAPPNERCS
jgi:hypothetical protein